ncbi:MAG: hypothetical protein ACK4F4_07435 [Hylemonella sp.]|uniref:hypothetical protein n=1 Tax=Hylemonella sp. TaxID=2066020 RepID=UPI00391A620B
MANYAALATAWALLCEFMGQEDDASTFLTDLTAEMNRHIKETASERQPWAWIVEKLLSEIAARRFTHPFKFDEEDEVPVLCVRTGYVMDYMRQTPYLNTRSGSKVEDQARPKKFAGIAAHGAGSSDQIRESMMLAELDAMGLSSTALQVAARIGFDNFMAVWQLLDMLPDTWSENESAILWRLPRLQAWRRYQRNRFVEALATAGWTQPEIRARVKQELGEDLSDRHMRRLMSNTRVRA